MNIDFIEDLSYSGLSGLIEGSETIGGKVITACAVELMAINKEIDEKEREILRLKSRKQSLSSVPDKVAKILKKKFPFYVVEKSFIVIVDHLRLSLEYNIMK